MAVTRGNLKPAFTFKNGAAAVVDFGAELRSVSFGEGEGEATTFAEVAAGVRPVAVTLTFDLEFGAGKAYDWFASNAGASNVAYVYKTDESKAVSATNPSWTGTATIPPLPMFELEANNEKGSFEVEIQLDSWVYSKTAS